MATTAGSLLGNFAPAMNEPYAIENTLASDVAKGNQIGDPGMARMLLGQYNLERQIREGDYANRLADQMAYGKQYLANQQAETLLHNLPELSKNNLIGAVTPMLQSQFGSGLNMPGLEDAARLARSSTVSTNLANAGKGYLAAVQGGATMPTDAMTALTGLPFADTGPLALRVQAAREQAANARARGAGGPTTTVLYGPPGPNGEPGQILQTQVRTKGGPSPVGGYNTSVPPAAGPRAGTAGKTSDATPVSPNYKQLDPANARVMATIIDHTKAANPVAHADIMAGAKGGAPNIVYDGQGNMFAVGASKQMHPIGNMAALTNRGNVSPSQDSQVFTGNVDTSPIDLGNTSDDNE